MEDLEMEDLDIEALEKWYEEGKPFAVDLAAVFTKYAVKISHSSKIYATACLLAAYMDNLADDPGECEEYQQWTHDLIDIGFAYAKGDRESGEGKFKFFPVQ